MRRSTFAILLSLALALSFGCSSSAKKKGTVCQSDNECSDGACVGGTCAALKSCQSQSECGDGVCSEGYCWNTQCETNAECPTGTECLQKYCVRKSEPPVDAMDGSTEDTVVKKDLSSEAECSTNEECVGKVGTVGQCETPVCASGKCLKVNKPKGDTCNDGSGCTTDDACNDNGTCVGIGNPCVDESDSCKKEANTSCTSTGDATYTCSYQKNVDNQVTCNDNDGCTSVDQCDESGSCVGKVNPCVDASDACKQESNSACTSTGDTTWTCSYQKNLDDSVTCNDKNGCTAKDSCDANGSCIGSVDPCVDTSDACKQVANSQCTSTGDTAWTCDYTANVTNSVGCDDQNVCTITDRCTDQGTCVGKADFGASCTLQGKSNTLCGFFGDCVAIESRTYIPSDSPITYKLLDVCQPTPNTMQLVEGQTLTGSFYDDLKFVTHSFSETGVIADRQELTTWSPDDYDAKPLATCSSDYLFMVEDSYSKRLKAVARFSTNWTLDTKLIPTMDLVKDSTDTFSISRNGFGSAMVHQLGSRQGILFGGNLGYWSTTPHYTYMLSCQEPETPDGDYSCNQFEMENVSGNWFVSAMYGYLTPALEARLWVLASNYDGQTESPGSWRINYYNGTDFAFDGTEGCDGSNPSSACYSEYRYYDFDRSGYHPHSKGLDSIDGLGNSLIVVVGGEPAFKSKYPPLKSDGPVKQGTIIKNTGTGWSRVVPIPADKLLTVTNAVLTDYVFNKVNVIDADTVLITGYLRACTETTADDCFTENKSVTMHVRPFMFVYRPNATSDERRFSKMVALDEESQMLCCNHDYSSCTDNSPACGGQEKLWSSYARGMKLYKGADAGRVVWVGSTMVDPSKNPEAKVWYFLSEK